MAKTRVALLLPFALAACATPKARVQAGLENAGLKPHLARCMAARLVDRLSRAQLHELASLPKAEHANSVDEFLYRVRALGDRQTVHVTVKAAALCATGLAD
ncbi:hypothetical protein EAH87_13490 [Sphingomonas koreensis]|nr:hypothetical protein EAH87_13490 [Sphingomonas koreensis]